MIFVALMLLLVGCGTTIVERAPSAAPLREGSSVGNGGDEIPKEKASAWFLGTQPIRYCVEVAPNFGVERGEALREVEAALDAWRSYIEDRQVLRRLGLVVGSAMHRARYRLTFAHRRKPKCDGSEELAFYLGVDNEAVRRAKAGFHHPIAFAQRETYDIARGRGRGFVWVAGAGQHSKDFPQWDARGALRFTLLHEIGHVAGCAHVADTVMDENLVERLRDSSEPPVPAIDGRRQLLTWGLPTITVGEEGLGKVRDLVEFDRQPGEAAVFKVVFDPYGGYVMRGALSTDTISYHGWLPIPGGAHQPVVLHYNIVGGGWRLFRRSEPEAGLELFAGSEQTL